MFKPTLTSQFLPGWVFNIATIVHAEEALLATVFLFSVHFFNVHFRPEKFPMSTTIFTGAVPLEEFKYEHTLEYDRLVASGELEKYLVKRPTRQRGKPRHHPVSPADPGRLPAADPGADRLHDDGLTVICRPATGPCGVRFFLPATSWGWKADYPFR